MLDLRHVADTDTAFGHSAVYNTSLRQEVKPKCGKVHETEKEINLTLLFPRSLSEEPLPR